MVEVEVGWGKSRQQVSGGEWALARATGVVRVEAEGAWGMAKKN